MIPAAPRKAFCPPDNCPSSQQCPRCRTNNRRLPRPVLPPCHPLNQHFPKGAAPTISTAPISPQPASYHHSQSHQIRSCPPGNTHSVRCKQHPHRSPASRAGRKQLCHDCISFNCCIHCKVTNLGYSRSGSSATK